MVYEPERRTTYRSPDAVLAEARRMADDIRRRAERDADDVRRAAAEWASAARRDADRYRARVLGEVQAELARAAGDVDRNPQPGVDADVVVASEDDHAATPPTPTPAERAGPVVAPDTGGSRIDLRPREPEPARRGTYVVGRPPAPVRTSIDTTVDDTVRSAIRRTFYRHYP